MNNKSGSKRLEAWVHWKLLEKDLNEDDKQFALDIQDLQKLCEEQKGEIEEVCSVARRLRDTLDAIKEAISGASLHHETGVSIVDDVLDLKSQLATQTERVRKLTEALNRYGSHDDGCHFARPDYALAFQLKCNCGFDQALKQESLGDGK